MTAKKKDSQDRPKRPWRDNIEAITMAIIVAVMLKYFIVEAYKIPTGSMQPTLLGNEETRIFDRIIVDKLSYHYRDPARFEVVVFKYPLDRSKNFIKRLVGMPGERLRIENGDVWTKRPEDTGWNILRRPRPIQIETWKRIDPENPRFAEWRTEHGTEGWLVDGRAAIKARGDGSCLLPSDRGSVRDDYRDGYPGEMGSKLLKHLSNHEVGDLRLTADVEALAGCREVSLELREGDRRYLFVLPGPAADDAARPAIRVEDLSSGRAETVDEVLAPEPWKLVAGRSVGVAAQNIDDLLGFEVDGLEDLELEVDRAWEQRSWFRLRVSGEGADLDDVEVYRDIYYTTDTISPPPEGWEIPAGHYFMLGDNTQDSSDSRAWTFDRWLANANADDDPDHALRANYDGNHNPMLIPGDPVRGTLVRLRDEWGELHTFPRAVGRRLDQERSPFVPRPLITGRAVLVFWPHVPGLGVWRLKWIH